LLLQSTVLRTIQKREPGRENLLAGSLIDVVGFDSAYTCVTRFQGWFLRCLRENGANRNNPKDVLIPMCGNVSFSENVKLRLSLL
jgi:hypothetical protein